MLMTPERSAVDVFGATAYWTVPFPAPDAPAVTVIQAALLVAVQEQAVFPATVTDALDPVAGTVTDIGDIVIVASHAAPACVTTNGWPATVIVAERELLLLLAAMT